MDAVDKIRGTSFSVLNDNASQSGCQRRGRKRQLQLSVVINIQSCLSAFPLRPHVRPSVRPPARSLARPLALHRRDETHKRPMSADELLVQLKTLPGSSSAGYGALDGRRPTTRWASLSRCRLFPIPCRVATQCRLWLNRRVAREGSSFREERN